MSDDLPRVSLPKWIGVTSNAAGATFGPRHLGDFEFVWMVEGTAVYRNGARRFELAAGTVVLCRPTPPEQTDAFDWDPARRSAHAYVHFNVTAVPAGFPPVDHWPWVRALPPGDVWRPTFLHLQALSATKEPAAAPLARAGLAQLLATFILGMTAAASVPSPDVPEPVALAVAHFERRLEKQPAAAVTLAELAGAAFVTPAYLCRAFKVSLGTSPLAAVRAHRLDRALTLLTRSNESVAAIARATGFPSQFHFSRRFKEAFGLGPLAMRREVRAGRTPPLPRRVLRLAPGTEDQSRA